ncbi:alpha/beta fold hydrolase [Planomicrobium sp. CPCC 101079]|uniref:alpha/beta fold hydrolase n=1 Tax=Planomicrobium sp. CPCC 101079 TaxID=2599618 RepID=UPI0011B3CC00|nr:alpha/beta hydrolase [Planomicrobium sp. CPCC 101079]TWT14591.1 alpha/beta hydrolase [Planomicrobium sp. CPCC 101079]
MKSIYKSDEGKIKLLNYYETYLDTFSVDFDREYVDTRHGRTHVLVTGPAAGKPIFIFQGGNCINPMTLSWFSGLLEDYRVYAPDTVGHPGYSEESRISAADQSFSEWVSDLMAFFQVEKAAFIGPSYGGGIILRLAAFMPEKIACAVLVAPAGLKLGSKTAMIRKILLPLMFYSRTFSTKNLTKITDAMSANSMQALDKDIIGEVFKNVKLEQEMPKLTKKKELLNYQAPTLLIAGEHDIFFPSDVVIKTAANVIPNLIKCCAYDMAHFPSESCKEKMGQEVKGFLSQYH